MRSDRKIENLRNVRIAKFLKSLQITYFMYGSKFIDFCTVAFLTLKLWSTLSIIDIN
jgi:hypothetical protein